MSKKFTKLSKDESKGVKTFYLPKVRSGSRPEVTLLVKKSGDVFEYGVAVCNEKDNFSRLVGRRLAFTRLVYKPLQAASAMQLQSQLANYLRNLGKRRPSILEKVSMTELHNLADIGKYFE